LSGGVRQRLDRSGRLGEQIKQLKPDWAREGFAHNRDRLEK
jgi:hypothetical protein